MKFYTFPSNKLFMKSYKNQLKNLKNDDKLSKIEYSKYMQDLYLIKKSLRHNLILFQSDSNPSVFYLMIKTTDLNGFESPLNAFELNSQRADINIIQASQNSGFSECLFQFELQDSNEIKDLLVPLNDTVLKESFGSLENAESFYNKAQKFYDLNKKNPDNWIDITRYFSLPDEIYKQYSYLNFNKDPYYPFSQGYEYDGENSIDAEALKLAEAAKAMQRIKKPSEEL